MDAAASLPWIFCQYGVVYFAVAGGADIHFGTSQTKRFPSMRRASIIHLFRIAKVATK